MKHVACRRDAHWEAARGGFYDAFATGVGLGAPPKSNATYDLALTAAPFERLLSPSRFVRQKEN